MLTSVGVISWGTGEGKDLSLIALLSVSIDHLRFIFRVTKWIISLSL